MGFRAILLLLVFGTVACNRPADYAVAGTAEVPSIHGEVEIERIDKEQILVSVLLDELPAPSAVEPQFTHYVLWFVVVGEDPKRQIALEYDPATRVGRASVPTSLREFEMRVTAESSEAPDTPGFVVVASQQIREKK